MLSPTALFMGVTSTATSVGITARLLSENRKLDTPEGVTTLAGAVFDDVLGLIILATIIAYISASQGSGHVDWSQVRLIAIKALSVWIGFTLLGLLVSRALSNFLKYRQYFNGQAGVNLRVPRSGLLLRHGYVCQFSRFSLPQYPVFRSHFYSSGHCIENYRMWSACHDTQV